MASFSREDMRQNEENRRFEHAIERLANLLLLLYVLMVEHEVKKQWRRS